jgi:predicted secreted acid phosphatase
MIPYTEIRNLDFYKDWLKNWVNSGQYNKDVSSVLESAYSYADSIKDNDKALILLDIDETMVSEYDFMLSNDFAWTLPIIEQAQLITTFPAIQPTLSFYNYCILSNVQVGILTSRRESNRNVTEQLLHNAGYIGWYKLILRTDDDIGTIADYKLRMRKELVNNGYTIQCNIGDQLEDFFGGYASYDIKIPNNFYAIGLER